MIRRHTQSKKLPLISPAFTLVELLFVVSILAVLSSVLLVATNSARAKGIEAKKVQEVRTVGTAVRLHQSKTAKVPGNYNVSGSFVLPTQQNPSPGNLPACENTEGQAYGASIQELLDSQSMPTIPRSPDINPYCYFDHGDPSGDGNGATFYTKLNYPIVGSSPIPGGHIYASSQCPAGQRHYTNGQCLNIFTFSLASIPAAPLPVGAPANISWNIMYNTGNKRRVSLDYGNGYTGNDRGGSQVLI